MFKKLCWLLCFTQGLSFSYAQQKQLSLDEAVVGFSSSLAIEQLPQAHWRKGTPELWYVSKDRQKWIRYHAQHALVDSSFTIEQWQNLLGEKAKNLIQPQWLSSQMAYVYTQNRVYLLEWQATGQCTLKHTWELPDNAANVEMDPLGSYVVFTIDNNLYWMPKDTQQTVTNKPIALTKDVNKAIVNGQSVHRNEFGISKGIFVSPKGTYIAYYRMDETMVKDYPIVDWLQMPAINKNIKYPMAGDASHHVNLVVYHVPTGQSQIMKTGLPKEQYLTAISWKPDESEVYIGLLQRSQKHLALNAYDPQSGQLLRTLFTEQDSKYVEPQHAMLFLPGRNDQFIWHSQRDGYQHLYLYNTKGQLLRQVTKGNWMVNEVLGLDSAHQRIIYTSTQASPLEKQVYTVQWTNGKIQPWGTRKPGWHQASVSSDGQYLYDVWVNEQTPRHSAVISATGIEKVLLASANPLKDYQLAKVQNVTLKAKDGTPLYGKLMTPQNVDPQKRYPVIVYLYNGPHLQLVKNTFPASGNLWYDYMVSKGYIVFSMDGRGSSNRGLAFEQAVHGQLGQVEMEDQLVGVQYLKSLSFVDSTRMGVHGWSFGGFMTTSLMVHHPDVFKAGVAGGPVMDWRMYEVMYTERYMGTPHNNAEGYAKTALIDKADKVKGRLLLIHGTDDDVVVWQHSMLFINKAVKTGTLVDYFVYPGHAHNVRGKDRVHLMKKVSDYFDQHLQP